MADINQTSWSETDASNNSPSPNGWASGTMLPDQVEPTARAMMGAIKRWHDQISPVVTSGGSANAQTLTHTVARTALVAGDLFSFIAGFTNTAATTLNVDGLGAVAIQIGSAALVGGEIIAGQMITVGYDGTHFQLSNPAAIVGTYSPTVTFGGLSTGVTYGAQVGNYKRIGKFVTVLFDVNLTSKGSATGIAAVSLPYQSAASAYFPGSIGLYQGMASISGWSPYTNNSFLLTLASTSGAVSNVTYTDANFTNTSRIAGSCTYLAA